MGEEANDVILLFFICPLPGACSGLWSHQKRTRRGQCQQGKNSPGSPWAMLHHHLLSRDLSSRYARQIFHVKPQERTKKCTTSTELKSTSVGLTFRSERRLVGKGESCWLLSSVKQHTKVSDFSVSCCIIHLCGCMYNTNISYKIKRIPTA